MNTTRPPATLAFMKMHGAGNDFVVIDSRGREAVVTGVPRGGLAGLFRPGPFGLLIARESLAASPHDDLARLRRGLGAGAPRVG